MKGNQDVYVSETWGTTVFVESPKNWSPIKTCSRCILREPIQDCRRAACSPEFRADGKDGFYTVRNYPNPEKS